MAEGRRPDRKGPDDVRAQAPRARAHQPERRAAAAALVLLLPPLAPPPGFELAWRSKALTATVN